MRHAIASAALAGLLASGCASDPGMEDAVEQTRQAFRQVAADPQIQAAAPTAILDAEQALMRADTAETTAEREHYLYVAGQEMAIARTVTERKAIETRLRALAEEREQVMLGQSRRRVETLEAELAALEAQRTERGYLVTLSDIFFETGQARLNAGADKALDRLARYMRDHPQQRMVVEGHTDSMGGEDLNQRLSERRAEAVKEAVAARGVASTRIDTRGYGESRPVAGNETSAGRQLNRRVEVILPQGS